MTERSVVQNLCRGLQISTEPSDAYIQDIRGRLPEASREEIVALYRDNVNHLMGKMNLSQKEAEEIENAHLESNSSDSP